MLVRNILSQLLPHKYKIILLLIFGGSLTLILLLICWSSSSLIHPANRRIVSIGPSASTIINALNAQNQVVGADKQSMYLYNNNVKDIGYLRMLSLEGIIALKPNICISVADTSPPNVLKNLTRFDIHVTILNPVTSVNSIYQNITLVDQALGKTKQAPALLNTRKVKDQNITLVDQDLGKTKQMPDLLNTMKVMVDKSLSHIPPHNIINTVVLLQISANSLFLLGKNTHGAFWLQLLGLNNILKFDSIRPVSKEGILALSPDLIIIARTSNDLTLPYSAELAVLKQKYKTRTVTIDSKILDGFGADFADNLETLIGKVYHDK